MDADKIKRFFVLHIEKMILAVVVVVSLLLVYQGIQLEDFRKEVQPDKLESDATQVRRQIDEDHTDAIIPEREPTFDIVTRTDAAQRRVDFVAYKLPNTWKVESIDSTIRREDPNLLPPRELIVRSFSGTIAVRSQSEDYELATLEAAEKPEKVERKKPKPRERRRNQGDEMMFGGEGMGGGEGMYGDGEVMEDQGSGMGGMDGESMAASRQVWSLRDTINFGIKPAPVPSLQNASRNEEPIPAAANFIIGTAVVPHREMSEAYNRALKAADGYDPRRDRPRYFEFQVERADVTAQEVEELTEDAWVVRGSRRLYTIDAAVTWAGFCPEVLPTEFRDEFLTTHIPPILIDDYRRLTGHPLIPNTYTRPSAVDQPIEDEPIDLESLQLAGPGSTSRGGEYGGGGMYGMSEGSEDTGYGGGGGGGMYGGAYPRGSQEDPVDYKLLRFYDFAAPVRRRDQNPPQVGRSYVYRVRVALIDPNFPRDSALQPAPSVLSAEVYGRVAPLIEASRRDSETREFQRWTGWSEPSPPVTLGSGDELFAGPVTAGKRVRSRLQGGASIEFERDPPKAKVVLSKLDRSLGTRVPFWTDVTEGSVLSANGDANVLDPISLEVKKLADAKIESGSTVIDLEGGQPLGIAEGDEMTEPGVMLLYDATTGQLKVTGELAEQRKYRIYSYADDRGL